MNLKYLLHVCLLGLLALGFGGCSDEEDGKVKINYEEYALTVASQMVPGLVGTQTKGHIREVYAVKKGEVEEWTSFTNHIVGFEFEKGYECQIKISKTTYLDERMGQPAWSEYALLDVISKEKKDSEGVPLHFIPERWYKDRFLPEYHYVVEAENKDLVEKDLKTNSMIPLDYHFLLYSAENGFLKWMAIKDNGEIWGPFVIKKTDGKKPEELLEVYKLLPYEGQMYGSFIEWSFLYEDGQETGYPSFDVTAGFAKKSKSVGLTPNLLFLYKDLTEYYRDIYPEAGVKAVVVRYDIEIGGW